MPSKTHLTVPLSFRKKTPGGCIVHKAILQPAEIEHRRGFNVTTPLRTLLDVVNSPLSQDLLEEAVRDALERGVIRRKQLLANELPVHAQAKLRAAVKTVEMQEVG